MKKIYIKKFEYKGQMVNYYNKVQENPNIAWVICGFFFEEGCYTVQYRYK